MLKTFSRQKSQSWVRKVGSTVFESWYPFGADLNISSQVSTVAPAINTLIAIPFLNGKERSIDRLAFEVITGGAAGSVARVGIYTNSEVDGELYPKKLVIDGGEYDTTANGIKSTSINAGILLAGGRIYWAVYFCGVSAPTLRAILGGGCANFLGFSSSVFSASRNRLTIAQGYGALPADFPAGAGVSLATIPMILVILRLTLPKCSLTFTTLSTLENSRRSV